MTILQIIDHMGYFFSARRAEFVYEGKAFAIWLSSSLCGRDQEISPLLDQNKWCVTCGKKNDVLSAVQHVCIFYFWVLGNGPRHFLTFARTRNLV